jgi:hypothetical protein
MNISDYFPGALKWVLRLKILKFFDADPGSRIFLIRDEKMWIPGIRDKHPGSATLILGTL